jgi:hypothetical protein
MEKLEEEKEEVKISKEKVIKFVAISDTHNRTDNYKMPNGDILLHAGDFT